MLTNFQINDPSLESQWRAIILFGKNSATYKFAFAKSLLKLLEEGKSRITIEELAKPFLRYILEHLKENDKQGSSSSSKFLNHCRSFLKEEITHDELLTSTTRLGFINVVDAFQNINGGIIRDPFYEKNYTEGPNSYKIVADTLIDYIKNEKESPIKDFYVDLAPESLTEMEIMMGPLCSKADEIILNALIGNYGLTAPLIKSEASIRK